MATVSALGSSEVQSQISTVEARLQAPITQLKSEITTDNAQISAWGSIKGTISSLSTALTGISSIATLPARSVTSTSSSVATATATNSAETGTFTLGDVTLARAQTIYSGIKASASASIGASAGSLTFVQNGKTETVSVGSGSLTLNGVAAAINKAQDGVTASVVNSTAGARLVLQGGATGSSQAFTVSGTGALASFDYNPSSSHAGSWTVAQKAQNANLTLNGVPISNATNALGSALPGVTITLAGSGNGTLTVSSTTTSVTSALSSVASSLNSAISGIGAQIKYTAATGSGSSKTAASAGPLLGNFTATNLSDQLLTAVSGAAASGVTTNTIGLTVSSTGGVSLDSATFAQAYAANPHAVQTLVSQIYTNLTGVTKAALGGSGSGSGSIGAETSSLNAQVTSINSNITEITQQNNTQLQILLSEYTLAESKASSASISQAYLSIFLNSGSSTSGG